MKIYKAYAKVNIFLKITGMRQQYHEIISRFMKIDSLYDELSFIPKESSKFEINGNFTCKIQDNTIYKAYIVLKKATNSDALTRLLATHAVHVKKNIPTFAGLGGGSSNAATFLRMCNEVLRLGLSKKELANLGLQVGADVPFFIYDYNSANVSGIGERVQKFDEETLPLTIITPDIKISTQKVYEQYRKKFYNPVDKLFVKKLLDMKSIDILNELDINTANDLFKPAVSLYPNLEKWYKHKYFFSGSGSSFFYLKNLSNSCSDDKK